MLNKENTFYVFLAMLAVAIIIFLNADKFWNVMDKVFSPLVNYNEEDHSAVAGAGSADANIIRNIRISWEKGDVSIVYAQQDRMTWKEVFTIGEPTQFNVMHYWMNTRTVYIDYFSQEYDDRNQKLNRKIRKDLQMFIPTGCVMDEIVVHTVDGVIQCEVEAKSKDLKSINELTKKINAD